MYTVCTESEGNAWTTDVLRDAIVYADSTLNALVTEGGRLVAFNCGVTKRVRATRAASDVVRDAVAKKVERDLFGMPLLA